MTLPSIPLIPNYSKFSKSQQEKHLCLWEIMISVLPSTLTLFRRLQNCIKEPMLKNE